MSRSGRLFAVENLQDAATDIEQGRVLSGFVERSFRRDVERFLGLASSFNPEHLDEKAHEAIDETIAMVIKTLESEADPFYEEARVKLLEAQNWIAQGHSPSKAPSKEQVEKLAQERAAVAMWGDAEPT